MVCAGQVSVNDLAPKQTSTAKNSTRKKGDGTSDNNKSNINVIGGAKFAGELDAKRAIKQGAELASRL